VGCASCPQRPSFPGGVGAGDQNPCRPVRRPARLRQLNSHGAGPLQRTPAAVPDIDLPDWPRSTAGKPFTVRRKGKKNATISSTQDVQLALELCMVVGSHNRTLAIEPTRHWPAFARRRSEQDHCLRPSAVAGVRRRPRPALSVARGSARPPGFLVASSLSSGRFHGARIEIGGRFRAWSVFRRPSQLGNRHAHRGLGRPG